MMMEVTTIYLEMLSLADLKPRYSTDNRFAVREATVAQWQLNRFLYLHVGGPWGWTDKCRWPAERWQAYVASPALRIFLGFYGGSIAGYYELHQKHGDVELAYFGLAPEFIGRGFGGPLLTSAIEQAWRWDAARVWVHTCTLDHPAALRNYEARGMRIYSTMDSPRRVPPAESAGHLFRRHLFVDGGRVCNPAGRLTKPPSVNVLKVVT